MLLTIEYRKHMKCKVIFFFTILLKILACFEFDGSNTSLKSWNGANKRLEKQVALKKSSRNILQLIR